jgi:hypothetical protein
MVNSREHAWPEWLLENIRQGRKGYITGFFGPHRPPLSWSGEKAALKVKYLCKDCNNGWMSDLEGHAQKIIRPLISDISLPLVRLDQRVLALWSIKTAMVFECTNQTKKWFYSAEERRGLRDSSEPPANTYIWIGRYSQSLPLDTDARKLSLPADIPFTGGYLTTFAIGHLVVQLLSVKSKPESDGFRINFQLNPWHRFLLQIWPVEQETVFWHPPLSFSEFGISLEHLGKRFTSG